MRISGVARTATAALPLLLGTTIPSLGPGTAAADTASPGATRYVAEGEPFCSDSGNGTMAQPFCTITAASAAARPGDTVMITNGASGNYNANEVISAVGTATAPITFEAVGNHIDIGYTSAITGTAITVSHARHVVLRGLNVNAGTQQAVTVSDSTDVTVDSLTVSGTIEVDGTSSGVTVSRSSLLTRSFHGPAIQVDPGAAGVVVSGNDILALYGEPGIQVTDTAGAEITGNTVRSACSGAVELQGASSGATVENNIVETSVNGSACTTSANATAISVASGSIPSTVADYNLFDPASTGAFYSWGGTGYATPAAFHAATGQGAHDIAADPQLTSQQVRSARWDVPAATSPAIDSADAGAPGELPTDFHSNPRMDDPGVADTGTGAGYYDRGAVELQGPAATEVYPDVAPAPAVGPLDATLSLGSEAAPGSATPWTADEPPHRTLVYRLSDSVLATAAYDLAPGTGVRLTFSRAGHGSVSYYVAGNDMRLADSMATQNVALVVGADYTPIAPVRLLDTRGALGVATTTPVAPGADVVLPVTGTGSVPPSALTAVVANVTVTQPTKAGFLTVYPDGESLPTASNLNFTPGRTVANLVTVPVTDGRIRLHNGSSGTVHVILDLQGYYSEQGYGFKGLTPVRLLDTRTGSPVPPRGTYQLDVGSHVPSGATAVALNVTVTQPNAAGFITAYPYGTDRPTASNLNFTRGRTVANLITVPLVDGKVSLYNASSGSTELIADLEGYYGTRASGATGSFVPDGPTRVLDTRSGLGSEYGNAGPLLPYETQNIDAQDDTSCRLCASASAWVFNVTATAPTRAGFLTVWHYQSGQNQRPNASNLDFTAGQTVPNLVMGAGFDVYNGSPGTTQVVVDEEGYFISR